MIILKTGDTKKAIEQTCDNCGCEFIYNSNDICVTEHGKLVICPCCGEGIDV